MLVNKGFDKTTSKRSVIDNVRNMFRRAIDEAAPQQVFQAVALATKDVIIDERIASYKEYEKKDVGTAYYLSMEFLMGRAPDNSIINICTHGKIKEVLDELGFDLDIIENQEPDAAPDNGSLDRLAACFLGSLATLGYPAYGCGIRHRYGMLKQKIENGYQVEVPGEWLKGGSPSGIYHSEYAQKAKPGGYMHVENMGGMNHLVQDGYQTMRAVPYDLSVIGYGNNVVNTLRIWDAELVNTSNLGSFDWGDYQKAVGQKSLAKTIVGVFHPNDSHYVGKGLRLRQQYFFISVSVQRAITEYKEKYEDIRKFHEKIASQLNDTHPTVAISELVRILLDEERLTQEEAQDVITGIYAHTSHTIISEALEEWPIELFSRLLPCIYQIVEEINRRFQNQIQSMCPDNQDKLRSMSIIYGGQVKMAYMAITASFSVNGVARLYTEILKNQELKDFYQMMSEKSDSKTNGIARRRFLPHGNPLLVDWVISKIEDERVINLPRIGELEIYVDDEKCQQGFLNIKHQNKVRLAKYIKEHDGISADPYSVFDIQIKRLYEYRRQPMNMLHVVYLYNQLKNNLEMDMIPRTFIFSIRTATGYKRAKPTIELISSVADMISNDKSVRGKIKVVFIENYRVSNAKLIFAVVDVNEQISTAGKEVSGTGNMKFMPNGILVLGTMDGVNVEIVKEVDQEYAFIFGMSPGEVINYESNGGYYPMDIFSNDQETRRVLTQLINGYYAPDDPKLFRDICNPLLNTKDSDKADTHLILKDLRSYAQAHERVDQAFRNEKWWAKAVTLNISGSGKFTPDRAVEGYVRDIRHPEKMTVEM